MARFKEDEKQESKLAALRAREEEDLAKILSQKYEVEYVDLSRQSINNDALQLLSEKSAREHDVAVYDRVGKKLSVAVHSPSSDKTKEAVKDLENRGYSNTIFMVSHASLERAWSRYGDITRAVETKGGVLDISSEEIQDLLSKLKTVEDAKRLIEETMGMKRAYKISRILEIVIAGGIITRASDVHIEPGEKNVRLRYRVDGVLTDITLFDRETYELLLSRIKLVSGMKLNVRDKAQDGRFSIRIDQDETEIRSSILPGSYGESVVMRLLNPETIKIPIDQLGIQSKLLSILEEQMAKPNGMILTTGPTGSGKTTTLYGILQKILTTDIKIITIEDPIEYHLAGIVQTQVEKKKYDFQTGLTSALRQDPDVIMIGEIRDGDVASTAIHASLTGHLVLSTLHTNNAAGSFPRLIDLGVNPKIIGSAVNITIAQRLVRKLCESCKKKVELAGPQKESVDKVLESIVEKSYIPNDTETMWISSGCEKCNNVGYKGRIGIFEAIVVDEMMEDLIKQSSSERVLESASVSQGILSIIQDGVVKVLAGATTLDELRRVTDFTWEK